MQVSYNGSTSVSQTENAGSIPVICSIMIQNALCKIAKGILRQYCTSLVQGCIKIERKNMAVIISQIISGLNVKKEDIVMIGLKKIGVEKSAVKIAEVHKSSLDARDNNAIKLVSSVWAELTDKKAEEKICGKYKFCTPVSTEGNDIMPKKCGDKALYGKVAVAGFGPAGMFAALTLAEYGYKPIVFERGAAADERVKAVGSFWDGGMLDESTNVQFGEGGAGTFSDGKLTTRINDPLCRKVLERFVEFGAPREILTKAKPHIGTDKLVEIVKNLRSEIIRLGGEVHFNAKLTGIELDSEHKLKAVLLDDGEKIDCGALVLAIGHSARDTFEMLLDKGIFIEPKPFSIGVRIEHTQEETDSALYGKSAGNSLLPRGEYQLSHRRGERGVYTFCMCPGGFVVPSQSERETVVTNGMSRFARDGENANSAVAVSVSPNDYGNGALDGVNFARGIEKKAFELAGKGYKAPACTVESFLKGGASLKGATVKPTYARGVEECSFYELFPEFITEMLKLGLVNFAGKMHSFGNPYAVMTAPETRTSSPVRITRGANGASISADGIYPCGEGAGYAGGIMSASVDGINSAIKIIELYRN